MSNKLEFAEVLHLNNGIIESFLCKHEVCLNKLTTVAQKNLVSTAILILDLHNVTDLFTHDEHLSDSNICVLSFVGRSSETRNIARDDIAERIKVGQVTMGILVFARPTQKKIDKFTNIEDAMGTKAWVINHLNNCLDDKQFSFVDDSSDHIDITTKFLGNNKNIRCFLVDESLEHARQTIQHINNLHIDN
jgi:hypothetical protein